jgi:hypothetical protein
MISLGQGHAAQPLSELLDDSVIAANSRLQKARLLSSCVRHRTLLRSEGDGTDIFGHETPHNNHVKCFAKSPPQPCVSLGSKGIMRRTIHYLVAPTCAHTVISLPGLSSSSGPRVPLLALPIPPTFYATIGIVADNGSFSRRLRCSSTGVPQEGEDEDEGKSAHKADQSSLIRDEASIRWQ